MDLAVAWSLVEKARTLLAAEQGAVVKDWGGRLPIALVYPSPYYVGMSSLGLQSVYRLFNSREDVVCERVFLNLGRRSGDLELVSLESQRPLTDFAVVAFSVSYELDYIHLVQVLREAGIPPLAEDRGGWPLVIAGGAAVTGNPAPLAAVVDAAYIGEIEEVVDTLVPALTATLQEPPDLGALSGVPGVYVPDRAASGSPPRPVQRQWTRDLDRWPADTAVSTRFTEFGDMHLVEAARGCARGCRFCLAGQIYRPLRGRSPEKVLQAAEVAVNEGRTIGLLAPSLSDWRGLRPVLENLVARGARVSVSSLRADTLDDNLARLLVAAGNESLTIAPEAGSQRLRDEIGKHLDREEILSAAEVAERHGLAELKLYFMLGLPTETDADAQAAADLVLEIRSLFRRRIVANVAGFVPKASTPFQWHGMAPTAVIGRRMRLFERGLRGSAVDVRAESPRWGRLQAVFSRGDERVGRALAATIGYGRGQVEQALREAGVDLQAAAGEWPVGSATPWDFLEPFRRGTAGGLE